MKSAVLGARALDDCMHWTACVCGPSLWKYDGEESFTEGSGGEVDSGRRSGISIAARGSCPGK